MVYTEWLRVRNCLRITGFVLLAVLLLAAVVRLSLGRDEGYNGLIDRISTDSATTAAHSVLPDGTQRTVLTDARDGSRIVIDNRGYNGKHITITEPTTEENLSEPKQASIGSIHVESTVSNGKTSVINVDTDGPTDFSTYVSFGLVVAFILATAFGAPFARENDGHLEIALTKPITRIRLALEMMGVDAVGIVAGTLLSIVTWIAISALFESPRIVFTAASLIGLAAGLFVALAWYAMLSAATASLKRSYGAILGLAWPVSGAIVLLWHASFFGDTSLGHIFHSIFSLLAHIDPISYLTRFGFLVIEVGRSGIQPPQFDFTRLWMVLPLLIAYVALAVFQWRRVEA